MIYASPLLGDMRLRHYMSTIINRLERSLNVAMLSVTGSIWLALSIVTHSTVVQWLVVGFGGKILEVLNTPFIHDYTCH